MDISLEEFLNTSRKEISDFTTMRWKSPTAKDVEVQPEQKIITQDQVQIKICSKWKKMVLHQFCELRKMYHKTRMLIPPKQAQKFH